MWTVVYIASNRTAAEKLKKILDREGLLVRLRTVGIPHSGYESNIEVLVPESEAEEAHEILSTTYVG